MIPDTEYFTSKNTLFISIYGIYLCLAYRPKPNYYMHKTVAVQFPYLDYTSLWRLYQ